MSTNEFVHNVFMIYYQTIKYFKNHRDLIPLLFELKLIEQYYTEIQQFIYSNLLRN